MLITTLMHDSATIDEPFVPFYRAYPIYSDGAFSYFAVTGLQTANVIITSTSNNRVRR